MGLLRIRCMPMLVVSGLSTAFPIDWMTAVDVDPHVSCAGGSTAPALSFSLEEADREPVLTGAWNAASVEDLWLAWALCWATL